MGLLSVSFSDQVLEVGPNRSACSMNFDLVGVGTYLVCTWCRCISEISGMGLHSRVEISGMGLLSRVKFNDQGHYRSTGQTY